MNSFKNQPSPPKSNLTPVLIWDWPIRIFHWSLVALVIMLWATSQSNIYYDIDLHIDCGYAVLTLLLFRLMWGVVGSHHACFNNFVCGIQSSISYARGLFSHPQTGDLPNYLGHNPLGGWSVLFLLTALLIETGTGLFATDDIITDGPLYSWVAPEIARVLTTIHRLGFFWVLLPLIALHITAILFYLIVKRENLVRPMVTGHKWLPPEVSAPSVASLWQALVVLGIAAGMVYLLIFVI